MSRDAGFRTFRAQLSPERMVGARSLTFRAYHSPGPTFGAGFELSEPIRARTDSESSKSCPNTTKTRPQPRFRIRKVRNPATKTRNPPAQKLPTHTRSAPLHRQDEGLVFAMRGSCSGGRRRGLLAGLHRQNEGLVFAMRGRRGNRSALRLMCRPPRRPAARLARPPTPPARRVCLRWW